MITVSSELPDRFTLYLTEAETPKRFCKGIWQIGVDVGVMFLKEIPTAEALSSPGR